MHRVQEALDALDDPGGPEAREDRRRRAGRRPSRRRAPALADIARSRRDELAGVLDRGERVEVAVDDEERRRVGCARWSIGESSANASGSSAELLLHDHRLEEPADGVLVPVAEPVGEVVDAVERHGRPHRRVDVLEAGLVRGSLAVSADERGEVAAGRPAGDAQEVGVAAVLVGVLAPPGDRLLAVDEVLGERRPRATAGSWR